MTRTPVFALVADALDVALAHGVSAYDACYVAAAESLKLPLATEDRRLAGSIVSRPAIGWKELLLGGAPHPKGGKEEEEEEGPG